MNLGEPVHSPEPWEMHDAGTDEPTICGMNGDGSCHQIAELVGCQGMSHEHLVACGSRIVACVNACEGIPTEDLQKMGLAAVHKFAAKRAAKLLSEKLPAMAASMKEMLDDRQ